MEFNKYFDHTLLKPEATSDEIKTLCMEAVRYGFASVCVNPVQVKLAAQELKASDVKVCTVVGFPLGANTTAVKVFETKEAVSEGADEIDMVINVGAMKEGRYEYVKEEIAAIKAACQGKLLKVILEICLLTDEEIAKCCELCVEAGADYVKTSTGFNKSGATVHAVEIMANAVGSRAKVKAAGGIRDNATAHAMIDAGAMRIGASKTIEIVENEQ